jgi:hypothetical protein
MNDNISTKLKDPQSPQCEVKLSDLSIFETNSRQGIPNENLDPVLLSEKELAEYEAINGNSQGHVPAKKMNKPTQKPIKTLIKATPSTEPEGENKVSLFEENGNESSPKDVALNRAQQTINDYTPSIGLSLSSARRARQFDLLVVAEETRIPKSIIENIEQGNFDKAPAPVYTRAYIKKLAEFYDIDHKILVEQYNEMLEIKRRSNPVKSAQKGPKKQNEAKSVNLQPVVTKVQGDGKLFKRIIYTLAFLLTTWIIVDCTGGKKPMIQKQVVNTGKTIKTVPVLKVQDLSKYTQSTQLGLLKLEVPKTKIK